LNQIKIYFTLTCLYALIIAAIAQTAAAQDLVPVKDQDGNIYKTVKIGNQIWMAENLRTTKYTDGTSIPYITENSNWINTSTPAYCWYRNDTAYIKIYGALYNGYAVNTNKICPAGWHVSTDGEWTAMVEFLGGKDVAAAKLKESGISHWTGPDSRATNESGFSALPGGTRYVNGIFFSQKDIGYWWTFTGSDELNGWYRSMYYSNSIVDRNYHDSTNGFSVRCVKD
jgi:uncharacterized protein (TIGR02145 family)